MLGAGVAVASIGGLLHWSGRVGIQEFDRDFTEECGGMGCFDGEDGSPSARLDRAVRNQRLGVTGYILGGTVIAAGLTLIYLNREQKERHNRTDDSLRLSITPMLAPDGGGVAASASF